MIEEEFTLYGYPDTKNAEEVKIDLTRCRIFFAEEDCYPVFNYAAFGKFLYTKQFCEWRDSVVNPYGFSDNVLKKIDELKETIAAEPCAAKKASTRIIDDESVLRLCREYFVERLKEIEEGCLDIQSLEDKDD